MRWNVYQTRVETWETRWVMLHYCVPALMIAGITVFCACACMIDTCALLGLEVGVPCICALKICGCALCFCHLVPWCRYRAVSCLVY
ncbi:hypothetical protein EDC01DRAFT_676496 [Geopyxis carbonaria]|nr:hypothetical protein EDC01DRAFT_676496 [Geopyxis carbonaria]